MDFRIKPAKLDDPQVAEMIATHVRDARSGDLRCDHALEVDELRAPEIELWSAWDGDTLLGLAGLKTLTPDHGEVKSMHTAQAARRRGVGSALLTHLLERAEDLGLARVSLETGSWAYFDAARALYERFGFERCAAFGGYPDVEKSVFMTLSLSGMDVAPA